MANNKADSFASWLIRLIFLNEDTPGSPNIGSDGLHGSTIAGNLYLSLHTSNPSAGDQGTSEVVYAGYNRVPIPRGPSDWVESVNGRVENINSISFPVCSGGSTTATHFGIGTDGTPGNATPLLYAGSLNTPNLIVVGVLPTFAPGQLTVQEL